MSDGKDSLNLSGLGAAVPNTTELSAEDKTNLVESIKNTLQGLAARHTDVLESLEPKVRKRVEVLKEIQGASNPVEAEAAHSNGNNRGQDEARTSALNTYSNRDTSGNEKNNKGIIFFVYAIADKMPPFLIALTIFGLVYSHGPNPLLRISDTCIQFVAAGGVISTIGSIILTGSASYFKEIESPDHPGFVLISTMVFFILQYSVVASCIILHGFERSSNRIIWAIGALVELSIVAFWFAFQREPMNVWLEWTKNAFNWMLNE